MIRLYFLPLFVLSFLYSTAVRACGYGFIGNCSTNIGLRVNGTIDSFAIAPCPDIPDFHGLQLKTIQSLSLIHARSLNWESCYNNVTSVTIYFRVFPKGMPDGPWQTLSLPEDYKIELGPYTTRYRSVEANVNLTAGLTLGQDYTLEAYFHAEVDTTGDDFLPETFIVQDNNGLNYQLHFRYGGALAPPFTLVNTKRIEPACHGDTTGVVGVSVYGNQTNLFYHWNYGDSNFPTISNVPAGVYTVTVTGIGGYSQADTVVLNQPQSIDNQFIDFIPFNCDSSNAAQVTAQASGGTGPYSYKWNNGSLSPALTVTTPGDYTVTVTDARGCSRSFTRSIHSDVPIVSLHQQNLCNGLTQISYTVVGGSLPYQLQWDNPEIQTNPFVVPPGLYSGTVTDVTGCYALFKVMVSQHALAATVQMASSASSANGMAAIEVSGGSPPYSFLWSDGSTAAQISHQLAGTYCVTATDNDGCTQDSCLVISYPSATGEPTTSTLGIVPHPATPGAWLALHLPPQLVGEKVWIEIFDMTGRLWWRENQLASTVTLPVLLPWQTPSGLLVIRVRGAAGQVVGKCVAR